MNCLSSIFSFKTLQIQVAVPKAGLTCFAIVFAAEILLREGVRSGLLAVPKDLESLTGGYERAILTKKPGLWFLGNSTLHSGIDVGALEAEFGGRIPMVSLSHGSATLDASAAMLKHYSRATGSVPEQVVLIIGKDDLNLGGYRAEKSRRYLTYRSGVVRKLEDFPALSHAGRSTTSQWSSIFKKRLAQVVGSVSERNDVSLIYHGEMPPEVETLLRSLARDYTFDFGAFQHVDVLQRELKIKAVSVVLLPCTDRYVEFHDLTNPKSPYAAIRKEIRDTCRLHGFSFLDLGDATSQHELFSDPYHPNTKGRDVITARMKVWMKAHLNSGTLEPDD